MPLVLGEAYRLLGYRVTEIGGGGADGGVDLMLTKGGEKFLVQCKQWKAYKIGVDVVRELYGVMAAKGDALVSGSARGLPQPQAMAATAMARRQWRASRIHRYTMFGLML